ncbi:hypothetical protein GX48_01345 [Paracoccidioides brasiliensis]|nr:hypothetical protein GX48_01345 [Paracoccidioides brasiliensis]
MPPNLSRSVTLFRVHHHHGPGLSVLFSGQFTSSLSSLSLSLLLIISFLMLLQEPLFADWDGRGNPIPLNPFPLEDYLFHPLKTHKPEQGPLYPYVHSLCRDAMRWCIFGD